MNISIGIIAFSSTNLAVAEAAKCLAMSGISTSYLELRALSPSEPVQGFIRAHTHTYIVEFDTGGQLHQLLQTTYPDLAPRLISLCHSDCLPLAASQIVEEIIVHEEGD